MAHKKNKTEILDSIITKDSLSEAYHWWCYWDDDDDYYYHDYYCDCALCSPNYDYLPDEFQPKSVYYSSKRGSRITYTNYQHGMFIDMNSIYSKEVRRQKKINYLLGIEEIYQKPLNTLEDFLNIKK